MRYLTPQPIDPAALLAEARRDGDGGLALFVGVVRDENEGRAVSRLEYEAYGEMAERELAAIAARLAAGHGGARVVFRHRVGSLRVGDVAVAVVASAPHREEAFAACRQGIEEIKAKVPIWKREFSPDGSSVWVEPCGSEGHNTENR
ncbi:MAG TPA: molybdenum cofactor biosynthesis protein MoaE [Thermoanaerobaculia bacterium]|nr:molybdenum cofactor biosynthesis protein MoaE [Thermoanaerobaculia bacterium]